MRIPPKLSGFIPKYSHVFTIPWIYPPSQDAIVTTRIITFLVGNPYKTYLNLHFFTGILVAFFFLGSKLFPWNLCKVCRFFSRFFPWKRRKRSSIALSRQERVEEDRSIAIEAAIVRIMKMRKTSGNPEEMGAGESPKKVARFEYY